MNPNLPSKPITRRERAARVGVALAALAASKHYKLDDLSIEVYARVLADVPVNDIEAVCREMEKTGEWMPKPAALRAEAVLRVFRARRAALTQAVDSGSLAGDAHCRECFDTGWKYVSKSTVAACSCRTSNPVFQLRHIGE